MKKRMNFSLGVNFEQQIKDVTVKAAIAAVREDTSMKVQTDHYFRDPYYSGQYTVSMYTLDREIALKKGFSYQTSGSISYKAVQLGAGFINNGEINLPENQLSADKLSKYGFHVGDAGTVWNVGGKVTVGCVDIGIGHHDLKRRVTNYDYSRGTINSLTIDFQVVSGVKIFAEIDHIDAGTSKEVAAAYGNEKPVKNKGTLIMAGAKVSF
jgi:hypothetical protein